MATVRLSPRAVGDLERIFEFIAERDPALALAAVTDLREAVRILARHPLIGRRVDKHRRELVISKGRTGYVALYRFFEAPRRRSCSGSVTSGKPDTRALSDGEPVAPWSFRQAPTPERTGMLDGSRAREYVAF